jgi:segregation and condensation protein B
VEACLFAMAGVVTTGMLAEALRVEEHVIGGAIEALRERQARTGAGVRVVPVGDGWQLRTEPRLATWVAAIRGGKPFKLSKPALETLTVVAFRQPVTKGAVDDLRGVDSGGVLRSLMDRGLVRLLGRSEEPGRPLTYGTTPAFLELFGMRSLADLPTLKDLRQLQPDELPEP